MTDAGGQYAPGGAAHGAHVELLFAPVTLEYEPAPQGVHAAEPLVPIISENVPAGQSWQEVGRGGGVTRAHDLAHAIDASIPMTESSDEV